METLDSSEDWKEQLDQVESLLYEEICLFAKFDSSSGEMIGAPSQPELRAMVRSAFSLIEALVFAAKTMAIRGAGPGVFSPGEIALAQEEDYELSDQGDVQVRSARLSFLNNLRFAFKLLAKKGGVAFALDVAGNGWASLKRAIKVRDRLMHPKWPRDLEVTDAEAVDTVQALSWLHEQLALFYQRSAERTKAETARKNAETEQLRSFLRALEEGRAIRVEKRKGSSGKET